MKVSELMTTEVVTTTPTASLKDVARKLVEHDITGMPVCDDAGNVVGVISEGDILYKERGPSERRSGPLGWLVDVTPDWELEKTRARTAGEAMSAPAITVTPIESAARAARLMTENGINRLPVVAMNGSLAGIITRTDLVRAFVRPDEEIAAEIRDDVLERILWADPGSIEITVSDGEVDLAGRLQTETEVQVLEKLVAKIPGVVTVRSTVTAPPPGRVREKARP
jgi:CBS domain-containing protein